MSSFANGADASATGSGTSLNVSSTVATGENVTVLVFYGSGTAIAETVSDGVNTYTKLGSTLVDPAGGSFAQFEALNVTGGTRNINFSLASAAPNRMVWYGRAAVCAPTSAQVARQTQASPGTGTDAVTSGTITPAAQPGRQVGICIASSVVAITAGTGYTDDGNMPNTESFGLRTRVEDKPVTSTSATAATATLASNTKSYAFTWYYQDEPPIMGQVCM